MKAKQKLLATISSLLLPVFLTSSVFVPLSASADSALLSTDKMVYTEGEAIMVTAAGTGSDI